MIRTLADAWLHDLSPFALRFTETIGIRWYGLAYAMGFLLGYLALRALARRRVVLIPAHRCGDAMLAVIVGVVVGGRLGYVLFYEPSLLWDFSGAAPWWGVLAVQRGGMASHGGIIGVIIAAWRISRGWKLPDGTIEGRCSPLHAMDVVAALAPIGLFLGRLANFVNGELLGRVVASPGEPAPWWAVRFPQEVVSGHQSFRTDAQERALDGLVRGQMLPEEAWAHAYDRIVDTIQGGGAEGRRLAAELAPLLSARYPSQLLQAAGEGIVLGAALWLIWARPRKPGVVGSWFMIIYGAQRVLTEFVRLPDAHLQVQRVLGFSRGQWLSVLMVVIGIVALVAIRRSKAAPVGGWRSRRGPP
ncbi:MAG TPA: prolipoprotein diacylglyceryl transferase [Phycisphaerales bacterium]|nr:prolipoprotein diacylglyceryl transferase [Phycisphaerales bacterium]